MCRYSIDYRAAGFNHWGYLAGCEFAESSVKEVKASTDSAVQRFTCQRELSATTECTVDLTSLGVCIADANFDGLPHVQVWCLWLTQLQRSLVLTHRAIQSFLLLSLLLVTARSRNCTGYRNSSWLMLWIPKSPVFNQYVKCECFFWSPV